MKSHHHFIDEETGVICDIPANSLPVTGEEKLKDFEAHEYRVMMGGRRRKIK